MILGPSPRDPPRALSFADLAAAGSATSGSRSGSLDIVLNYIKLSCFLLPRSAPGDDLIPVRG